MRKPIVEKTVSYLAWAVALIATLGSLYFSEFANFPPCDLCWYQRIFIYPLPVIIGIGIIRQDKNYFRYVWPLGAIGLLIAGYHNLLYYGLIPKGLAPCSADISCVREYITWLGFIDIPLLSLMAFALITVCMIIYWKSVKGVYE